MKLQEFKNNQDTSISMEEITTPGFFNKIKKLFTSKTTESKSDDSTKKDLEDITKRTRKFILKYGKDFEALSKR